MGIYRINAGGPGPLRRRGPRCGAGALILICQINVGGLGRYAGGCAVGPGVGGRKSGGSSVNSVAGGKWGGHSPDLI